MEYKTMEKAGGGKKHPVLRGNFMQPGAFKGYSAEKMKSHLQTMYDIGIDILVLQWSFENTSEGVTNVYYRSSFESADKSSAYNASGENLLGNILEAAEAVGVKVFVGMNNNDEWWEKAVSDKAWLTAQAELGIKGAKQLYATYKKQYPNAFYGWYFVFEMYNTAATREMMENGAYLLNGFCDGLTEIDAGMPMMLSPFLSAYGTEPEVTGQQWKEIFSMTHFREGDIFCCQDSVGAGFITVDQLDGYFKAIKEAVDTKKGLHFWANNEDFDQASWGTAPLDRFAKQLQISDPYVEAHITFAYSHHQHPDMGKTGHHEAYKYYYETGKLPTYDLASPTVTYEVGEEGVSISGTLPNEKKVAMGFRIYKNGELLKLINLTKDYDKSLLSFNFTDTVAGAGSVTYKVCAVDYRYRDGAYSEFTVNG
jgi:hypothetical protein